MHLNSLTQLARTVVVSLATVAVALGLGLGLGPGLSPGIADPAGGQQHADVSHATKEWKGRGPLTKEW